MKALLPILYFVVLALLLFKLPFFQVKGLKKNWVTVLFSVKVLAGFTYLVCHQSIIAGGDIFDYFNQSQLISDLLYTRPSHYIEMLFGPNGDRNLPPHLLHEVTTMYFWHDTSAYFMLRINTLFRLLSFGNIYVHSIFFSFLSFTGCVALAKAFGSFIGGKKKYLFLLTLFPSILFWTSGMHKESVMTFTLGLICYSFVNLFVHKKKLIANSVILILSVAITYLIRDFLLFLIIPPLVVWLFILKKPRFGFVKMSAVYLVGLLLGIFIKIPGYGVSFLRLIQVKREGFQSLKLGSSAIDLPSYEPTIFGFIKVLPFALYNSLLRPIFFEAQGLAQMIAAIENLLIVVCFILFLVFNNVKDSSKKASIYFFAFFGFSLLITIGLIVPNIGAIARYRSLALLFLLPALISCIDFNRIKSIFSSKKS